MGPFLKLLLSLTLSGSILAGLVLIVKTLAGNRLPKSLYYWLWIIVLLRFLIPWSFEKSVMNTVFYSEALPRFTSSVEPVGPGSKGHMYIGPPDWTLAAWNRPVRINQWALCCWSLGAAVALVVYAARYARLANYLSKTNIPASPEDNLVLRELLKGKRVKLFRNSSVKAPLLMGFVRPRIILPDIPYSEGDLKNIFLHEITHLQRFDLAVNWLAGLISVLHWFNPLVYLVKREINQACELACNEKVIRALNLDERLAYQDTLVAVLANPCPRVSLHGVICEEKRNLKRRTASVLCYTGKTKMVQAIAVFLLMAFGGGALYLGAGSGIQSRPPTLYIMASRRTIKEADTGTYSWNYLGNTRNVLADVAAVQDFGPEHTISVVGGEYMLADTRKSKVDKKTEFTLDSLEVYKDGQLIPYGKSQWGSYISYTYGISDGCVHIPAPEEEGSYVFNLCLDFGKRGKVNYSFVVEVGELWYDLADLAKYRTSDARDTQRVTAIAHRLQTPGNFVCPEFSVRTKQRPYELQFSYNFASDIIFGGVEDVLHKSSQSDYSNALIAFAMIDNLEKVTFVYRLGREPVAHTFTRAELEAVEGNLSELGQDLERLKGTLLLRKHIRDGILY